MDYLTYRWTNTVYLFYTTYISVYLAHHEIYCAKVGKGGINVDTLKAWKVHYLFKGSQNKISILSFSNFLNYNNVLNGSISEH